MLFKLRFVCQIVANKQLLDGFRMPGLNNEQSVIELQPSSDLLGYRWDILFFHCEPSPFFIVSWA